MFFFFFNSWINLQKKSLCSSRTLQRRRPILSRTTTRSSMIFSAQATLQITKVCSGQDWLRSLWEAASCQERGRRRSLHWAAPVASLAVPRQLPGCLALRGRLPTRFLERLGTDFSHFEQRKKSGFLRSIQWPHIVQRELWPGQACFPLRRMAQPISALAQPLRGLRERAVWTEVSLENLTNIL